jgi:uncharacterized membrane protein YdjX (TVP38/TMEM64 family)
MQTQWRWILKALGVTALVALLAWAGGQFIHPNCDELHALIDRTGAWGPWIYFLGGTLAMVLFVPRTVVAVIAGVAFGFWPGFLLLTLTSEASAAVSFAIARHWAREPVERHLWRYAWFSRFGENVAHRAFIFVLLTRAIHLFPYAPVNYAFGLFHVRWVTYLVGTFVGLIPGSIALVYAGNTLGCALLEGKASLPPDVQTKLILSAVLLTVLSLLPLLVHRRRR